MQKDMLMLTESYKGLTTVEHMSCVQSFQLRKLPLAALLRELRHVWAPHQIF